MQKSKKISSISIFIIITLFISSCAQKSNEVVVEKDNMISQFDSVLAMETEADDYGMKKYYMAFLKKGPNRDIDSASAMELQRAHLDNIGKMAEEGKLVLAGPFLDDGEIRGIYIFNVSDEAEAKELTNSDPAVKAGSLIMELHPWYGSAALMKVNEIHKKLSKLNP